MGIILFIISIILVVFVGAIGLIITVIVGFFQFLWNLAFNFKTMWTFKGINDYFMANAIAVDILGSSLLYPVWNTILIKNAQIHPFGRIGETISDNLGDNKAVGNLTKTGMFLCNVLNLMEKDHVEKSSKPDQLESQQECKDFFAKLFVVNGKQVLVSVVSDNEDGDFVEFKISPESMTISAKVCFDNEIDSQNFLKSVDQEKANHFVTQLFGEIGF